MYIAAINYLDLAINIEVSIVYITNAIITVSSTRKLITHATVHINVSSPMHCLQTVRGV